MTTIGVDFASVDHNGAIDFSAAKNAGARFAIPRAVFGRPLVQGSTSPFLDPVWGLNKNKIEDAGLRRSAYLYVCYAQQDGRTPPPEEQADAFTSYVNLTPFKDMVPFFDVEQESNVLSPAEMYEWTLRVAKRLRAHYGAWPGMYTSARVWADNLAHHSPGPLLACPLWLAKPWPWPEKTPVHLDGAPSYSPVTIPEWGSSWALYQYQGDATGWPGFISTVDANRARVFGKGSKGAHVVWTQNRLGIAADGIFGDNTEDAVKMLQQKHKLTPDGIVGLDTFTMLSWSNPAPA